MSLQQQRDVIELAALNLLRRNGVLGGELTGDFRRSVDAALTHDDPRPEPPRGLASHTVDCPCVLCHQAKARGLMVVVVNGRAWTVSAGEVDYEVVVGWSGLPMHRLWTVLFHVPADPAHHGQLRLGERVGLRWGMVFSLIEQSCSGD